jgi:hypothetical protein
MRSMGRIALVLQRQGIGEVNYNIGGTFSYSRAKTLSVYNPLFNNSWDQYRNSPVNRYANIDWGYEVTGQFTSQEQIKLLACK